MMRVFVSSVTYRRGLSNVTEHQIRVPPLCCAAFSFVCEEMVNFTSTNLGGPYVN